MKKVSDSWINAIAVKDWMDEIVDNKVQEARLEKLGSILQLIPPDMKVHVYKGIEAMASAAGAVLAMETLEEVEYPFEYSFVYRGIEFFQVSKERLEGYA